MKTPDPIKILASSAIFLVVLYLTSDIIPAIALSLAAFLVLHNFLKLGGILFFTLLIYPLAGGYLTAAIGYSAFVIILGKIRDGRYAFGLALFFLILCPFFGETSAILAYIFLITGLVQEGIKWALTPKIEKIQDMEFKQINV